uniref:MeuNaTxbeta-1 n=1 Tax=Mesobuthus eupeus TaxID=34648 RepID=SCX1_MESEU|nr:RecName: Full=Sodium channel neurotoxin MeuNaTxalpha-15; AltName: Full=Sodium channel neurotoxin MeuNaTxalpha-6; Flags: Precursor [Mesobuthus eupeus]ABR21064.1 venom sodium channel toxin-7 [Mesobuthus eupeus]
MMKIIIFLIVSSLVLIGVKTDNGYLLDKYTGCKVWCVINNESCNSECKIRRGNYGYCYFWKLACYCEGAPKSELWHYETNKCNGRM